AAPATLRRARHDGRFRAVHRKTVERGCPRTAHRRGRRAKIRPMQRPTVTRPTPAPKAWAEPYFTVGVTGTNGKTSTTHLVAAALAHAGPGCVTISTLGYFAGDERNDGPRTHHRVLETLRAGAERGIVRAALECTSKA